jgi:hypothetical protein
MKRVFPLLVWTILIVFPAASTWADAILLDPTLTGMKTITDGSLTVTGDPAAIKHATDDDHVPGPDTLTFVWTINYVVNPDGSDTFVKAGSTVTITDTRFGYATLAIPISDAAIDNPGNLLSFDFDGPWAKDADPAVTDEGATGYLDILSMKVNVVSKYSTPAEGHYIFTYTNVVPEPTTWIMFMGGCTIVMTLSLARTLSSGP